MEGLFLLGKVVLCRIDILPPAGRVDGGDVDFLHCHHRPKCALRFRSALGKRLDERARRDLPRYSPAVLIEPEADRIFRYHACVHIYCHTLTRRVLRPREWCDIPHEIGTNKYV